MAPQPTLMFSPSGAFAIAVTSAPSRSNALGRDAAVGAVRAVDGDPEPAEIGAEAVEHVVEIALDRAVEPLDRASVRRSAGLVDSASISLLLGVGELAALAVEELDAVVLGRVVRRGDDRAEILREERDGRCRQHAAEHGDAAGGDDAARRAPPRAPARAARVAPDEHAPAARPGRRGPPEALDELRRQALPHHAANAVRSEVLPRHAAMLDGSRRPAPRPSPNSKRS